MQEVRAERSVFWNTLRITPTVRFRSQREPSKTFILYIHVIYGNARLNPDYLSLIMRGRSMPPTSAVAHPRGLS